MGMGMKRENIMVDIGLLVSRVSLGAYFAIAGYRKVAEEFRDGFGTFLDGKWFVQGTLQPDVAAGAGLRSRMGLRCLGGSCCSVRCLILGIARVGSQRH